jgi:hypothetical protein
MLAAVGKTVLISDYFEFERLAAFVGRYTTGQTSFVVGAGTLHEIFGRRELASEGAELEAVARLFKDGLRLFVYPLRDPSTGSLTTAETFDPGERVRGLYRYLLERGLVRPLTNYTPEHLSIFSRDVLELIRRGSEGWEQSVPPEVASLIRERRAFSHRSGEQRTAA